jgi:hypothetical protein
MIEMRKAAWSRAAAVTVAVAVFAAALPAGSAVAQQAPTVALEQARSGEDGTSGAGATSGSMTSGNDSAKRDKNGNGGTASAGSAGPSTTGTASDGTGNKGGGGNGGGGDDAASAPPLPENAEILDALGILDDVTVYGLDVLSGLDIPVELLPPPVEEPVSSVPDDINTGGQGSSGATSNVSAEPGSGSAPSGGSTNTVAADGTNSSSGGERTRDRPRKNDDGAANG